VLGDYWCFWFCECPWVCGDGNDILRSGDAYDSFAFRDVDVGSGICGGVVVPVEERVSGVFNVCRWIDRSGELVADVGGLLLDEDCFRVDFDW